MGFLTPEVRPLPRYVRLWARIVSLANEEYGSRDVTSPLLAEVFSR